MKRKKIVAANWKMNLTPDEGAVLAQTVRKGLAGDLSCEVVIAPPFTHLQQMVHEVKGSPIRIAAQNVYPAASGAFTGEISMPMLAALGVTWCITGHSERRQLFFEDHALIRRKVDAILQGGLTPIFCCGEPLDIRERGTQNEFVLRQLDESLFHLDEEALSRVVIAYEPIWAIGTGVTASPDQAQEMHAFIRSSIQSAYGAFAAEGIRILYGGSIKADNAHSLFTQPDVDGGLVGGASLHAGDFLTIIAAANT